MSLARKCVGFWFSAKKKKKVCVKTLREIVESYGATLKEIDFSQSLDSQGPFVAIIHKMTDRMIEAMDGNENAEKNMRDVEGYLKNHPETVVVDPLPSIRKLLDRFETYTMIKNTELCQKGELHIPTFAYISSRDATHILEEMEKHNVEFPFVCKKSIAHGSASHKMSIIFNKEGLKDVDPPCVVQTFVNHEALLHKIYVIANNYHVVKRPSLRNFSKESLKDHSTIFFNSHDISSGDSSRSKLTTPDADDVATVLPLKLPAVDALAEELHSKLNMTMYGVDIIASADTGKQYVIDVNVFPGYDGVPDFLHTMVAHVMGRLEQKKSNGTSLLSMSETSNIVQINSAEPHENVQIPIKGTISDWKNVEDIVFSDMP